MCPVAICFWVAIAANPLTAWKAANTERRGRGNIILLALATIY